MPTYGVQTLTGDYKVEVRRGALADVGAHVREGAGKVFVVTTADVWRLHGAAFQAGMSGREFEVLEFPGGEERKRIAEVEALAERMMELGGDRTSLIVAFGGGIVNDVGGFLAAVFMRGIPVLQIPTTLLSQVDAGVGGKTAVNLPSGKNLIGAFHQPLAVIIDPDLLATLSEREYRAGLAEVIKCGIIRDEGLFWLLYDHHESVKSREPQVVEQCIAASVRIKCEVVTADEKEAGLRRILNFGHTVGHALEAETAYARFLHGEAVALGMKAAVQLSHLTGYLSAEDTVDALECIDRHGPWPGAGDLAPQQVFRHLRKDKKTLRGAVHFVLTPRIGQTEIVTGVDERLVLEAIGKALA